MKDDKPLIKKIYSRKYPITMSVITGDFHVGHCTGLASDKDFPEGKTLTKPQEWLLGVFRQRFLPEIKHLKKSTKPQFTHGQLGGDTGDIDPKNRSNQYWSKQATVVEKNAIDLLEPMIELFDAFHAVRGTKSHTNGELDSSIAKNFDNCVGVGYENRYILEDVYIVDRHKGKNKSKWADENLLNGLRSEIMLRHSGEKSRIPDVSHRHHFHYYGTTPSYKPYRVFAIPSWQLPYDHEHVAEIDAVGGTAQVGGLILLYQNGQVVDEIPLLYTYPKEKPWTPQK